MASNIIFMGTSDFAVPILKSISESNHKIKAVYTQPPKKKSRGQKIEKSPINLESIKLNISVRHPNNLNSDDEYNFIKKSGVKFIIVVAYGQIIPQKILDIPDIIFLNIHASLLPRWRGAAPIQRSIIHMDKITGISIMKIISKLDAGPFMMQQEVKIEAEDNFTILSKKLSNLGSKLILKSLAELENKVAKFQEQDENKVSYARKIEKKESEVDWSIPAKNIIAKINGLNPFPGVWFKHLKNRIKIIQAMEVNQRGEIGEVLDEELTVGCKENSIKILSIQKEGKNILDTKSFLTGYKIKKGEKLI
ncbi:methionyl-tRNA formyltransferase [Pelagibacteraceae bacterium]|nr:methionyl-tRNA formyltransferase [Pelagibacteraceae bacterium]